jgi:hypothetical protein
MKQMIGSPCGNCKVHDEDVRTARELHERGASSSLIGAKYDRHAVRVYAVSQRRDVPVRYPQGRHSHSISIKHGRRLRFGHIHHVDIEKNASSVVSLCASQRRSKQWKCASLLIKKTGEEHWEWWRLVISRRTDNTQRLLTYLMAQPQQGRQIGDGVGMKVAYGDQR